jgi:signal transduction histidine kinase
VSDPAPGKRGSDEYAHGYSAGRDAELERARKIVHDDISGNLIAATFAVETARQKLEQEGRPEAEDLKRAGELIDRAINDLIKAFASDPPVAGKGR